MQFNEAYADTCSSVGIAARNGDVSTLSTLLVQGRPVDRQDNRGWRALHEAAAIGHIRCVKLLLKHDDVDPDWRTFEGETALYLACKHSDSAPVVKLLLRKNASVNLGTNEYCMPLHAAVTAGCLDAVKLLVRGRAQINRQDYTGETALHKAAAQNVVGIVPYLLENGADAHLSDDYHHTPLFTCARFGHVEVLKELVEHGVTDVNVRAVDGATPLMIAAQFRHLDCMKFLIEQGADPDLHTDDHIMAIHLAIQPGHANVLRYLTQVTSPSAVEDVCLRPFLHKPENCRTHGQLPEVVNTGVSPFQLAIEWNRISCLKILLDSGLQPDRYLHPFEHPFLPRNSSSEKCSCQYLQTPLSCLLMQDVAKEQMMTVMNMLLEAGSAVNCTYKQAVPPLLALTFHPQTSYREGSIMWQCVRILVEKGAALKCRERMTNYYTDWLVVTSKCGVGALALLLQLGLSPALLSNLSFFRILAEELQKSSSERDLKGAAVTFPMVIYVLTHFTATELHVDMIQELRGLAVNGTQQAIWDRLYAVLASPPSLQQFCRLRIRERIRSNRSVKEIEDALQRLPVPAQLHQYLMFADVDIGKMEDMFNRSLEDSFVARDGDDDSSNEPD